MEAELAEIRASAEAEKGLALEEVLIRLNVVSKFNHNFYTRITRIGSVEDPQGALQILTWWERNFVMFARTAQYVEAGDKVLIIVGLGHNYILHEFFGSMKDFTLVSPIPYLE